MESNEIYWNYWNSPNKEATTSKKAKVTYFYFWPTVLHDHAASRLVKIDSVWLLSSNIHSPRFWTLNRACIQFPLVESPFATELLVLLYCDFPMYFQVTANVTYGQFVEYTHRYSVWVVQETCYFLHLANHRAIQQS